MRRSPRRHRVGLSTADEAFDELAPSELRELSAIHWTPVDVAIRAATLLAPHREMRVLDVGSGIGKLCAIGALSSCGSWCGIETHELLVLAARRLARALGIASQTLFVHGDVFSIEWTDFDALYLYNPFEIPLYPEARYPAIDYQVQVARTRDRLRALLPNARS
jgi:protein-L-isoaspartate O-methyltransferase